MSRRWSVPTAIFAAVLLAVMSVVVGARSITAQDAATPELGGTVPAAAHPAHIHLGTCDSLGEVVLPLNDVVEAGVGGTPVGDPVSSPAADALASPMASPLGEMGPVIAASTTTVEAPLADIIAGGHAVNVHESAENIGNYIACGDIMGTGDETELTIALDELNDSGYEGLASLSDNGDGTTTVVVFLSMIDDDMMASPEASPTT